MSPTDKSGCDQAARVSLYALRALPASEVSVLEAHIGTCVECCQQMTRLRPVIDSFAYWPTDVLRPPESLWGRIARGIAADTDREPAPAATPATPLWREPEWQDVAPGICCKLLATDTERDRVSLLVRLAPGVEYPPHCHAGVEELHLIYGELWIDDRKLHPGDYNRAEPGSADQRVWSETGCTCVLVTSARDRLL